MMPLLNPKVRLPAYTRYDVWVFLSIIPLQVIISNALLLKDAYFSDWKVFVIGSSIYFFIMFLVFQVCGIVALKFLKRYPDVKDIPKRLVLSALSYIAITLVHIPIVMWIFDKIPVLNYTMYTYFHAGIAVICIVGNIIITIIFEALASFERWKATLIETEQLKKENLKSQLQSLKNQINPHFLFNSINSLSSLIADDPDKAELFLDEMSKVYRYLLRNNEDHLIELHLEIQFINSYYHLLKTRYGDGINLTTNIRHDCRERLIPPLTIQILVENAVKHNIISKDQPLNIEIISVASHQLIVKNNLQRKFSKVLSNGVGLENIAAKYQLLGLPDMHINENNSEFSVTVHLIEKSSTIDVI